MTTLSLPLLYSPILMTAGLLGALMLPRSARSLAVLTLLGGLTLIIATAGLDFQTELMKQDSFSTAWHIFFLVGAVPLLVIMNPANEIPFALVLGALLGMGLMAVANHLFMLFIGFELMSLSIYLLLYRLGKNALRLAPVSIISTGTSRKESDLRLESSIKYFFSGGVAASLFLFGMSIYYAATGSMAMNAKVPATPWLLLGVVLMACAAVFKIGAVPLHFWLPDVYETAAPELAGFMSTAVKAAGFLMLLRLMQMLSFDGLANWSVILPWLSVATMTLGNLLALRQQRLQRLLAYSSIAHAGYLLAAVWAWAQTGASPEGAATLYLYLSAYLLMNTGAFLFLRFSGAIYIRDLRQYGSRAPRPAFFFAWMILSLAGIPLTGGFLAKFFVIWDLIRADGIWLAAAVAFNSLVGLAYYFKILQTMAFSDAETPAEATPSKTTFEDICVHDFCSTAGPAGKIVMAVCGLGTLLLGIWPGIRYWIAVWLQGARWHY